MTSATASTDQDRTALAGKYMTFRLASECYGLQILNVREIIGLMEITRVPRTRDFVRGVVNLRGRVIPVVDLRLAFGMDRTATTDQAVIIVVQFPNGDSELTMGILADEVIEVLSIGGDKIEPPPNLGSGMVDTEFLLGIGKNDDRMVFLLDISRILSGDHFLEVASVAGDSVATPAPTQGKKEQRSKEPLK